jgi:hypothetical protein
MEEILKYFESMCISHYEQTKSIVSVIASYDILVPNILSMYPKYKKDKTIFLCKVLELILDMNETHVTENLFEYLIHRGLDIERTYSNSILRNPYLEE